MIDHRDAVNKLVHDVKSKSGSLNDAAELLRKASPVQVERLLPLMLTQAKELVELLSVVQLEARQP